MGPSRPTCSSPPPPVPIRYGRISSSTCADGKLHQHGARNACCPDARCRKRCIHFLGISRRIGCMLLVCWKPLRIAASSGLWLWRQHPRPGKSGRASGCSSTPARYEVAKYTLCYIRVPTRSVVSCQLNTQRTCSRISSVSCCFLPLSLLTPKIYEDCELEVKHTCSTFSSVSSMPTCSSMSCSTSRISCGTI